MGAWDVKNVLGDQEQVGGRGGGNEFRSHGYRLSHILTTYIQSHVYSSAAGQGSYHYNLQKPTGNVHVYAPSASFSLVPGRTGGWDSRHGVAVDQDLLDRQRGAYLWGTKVGGVSFEETVVCYFEESMFSKNWKSD